MTQFEKYQESNFFQILEDLKINKNLKINPTISFRFVIDICCFSLLKVYVYELGWNRTQSVQKKFFADVIQRKIQ